MFERFTSEARKVVIDAQTQCRALGHERIGSEHLLLALLAGETHPLVQGLSAQGLDLATVRAAVAANPTARDLDPEALRSIGVDLDAIRLAADDAFGEGALDRAPDRRRRWSWLRSRVSSSGHLPFTANAKGVLEGALREALALGHRQLGSEHVLLGLLARRGASARRVLRDLGTDPDALLTRLRRELGPDAAAS